MTHNVDFFADQAFLKSVKTTLENYIPQNLPDYDFQLFSTSIIQLVCALEANLNYIQIITGIDSSELSLETKITNISKQNKQKLDWGKRPWQDIKQLIRVRNWLVHFKTCDLGLIAPSGEWIKKQLKFDPYNELNHKKIQQYYTSVRLALIELVKKINNFEEFEIFNHLKTEQYRIIDVG